MIKQYQKKNHRKTDDLNKDQLKDDKNSSLNNKNIQRDTTKITMLILAM